MAKVDYRTKASECCRMALLAPSAADRATWLKLAFDWVEVPERTKGARPELRGAVRDEAARNEDIRQSKDA